MWIEFESVSSCWVLLQPGAVRLFVNEQWHVSVRRWKFKYRCNEPSDLMAIVQLPTCRSPQIESLHGPYIIRCIYSRLSGLSGLIRTNLFIAVESGLERRPGVMSCLPLLLLHLVTLLSNILNQSHDFLLGLSHPNGGGHIQFVYWSNYTNIDSTDKILPQVEVLHWKSE